MHTFISNNFIKHLWGCCIFYFSLTAFIGCNNAPRNDLDAKIKALALDTSKANGYIEYFLEGKDYKGCEKLLDTLIYFNPSYGNYFYKRAYCYSKLSQPFKAEKDWQRSISFEYRKSNCYYNLGLSSLCFGNDSIGKGYLIKSLDIDSNPDAKKLLDYITTEPKWREDLLKL